MTRRCIFMREYRLTVPSKRYYLDNDLDKEENVLYRATDAPRIVVAEVLLGAGIHFSSSPFSSPELDLLRLDLGAAHSIRSILCDQGRRGSFQHRTTPCIAFRPARQLPRTPRAGQQNVLTSAPVDGGLNLDPLRELTYVWRLATVGHWIDNLVSLLGQA
jgi:hypothetical protein